MSSTTELLHDFYSTNKSEIKLQKVEKHYLYCIVIFVFINILTNFHRDMCTDPFAIANSQTVKYNKTMRKMKMRNNFSTLFHGVMFADPCANCQTLELLQRKLSSTTELPHNFYSTTNKIVLRKVQSSLSSSLITDVSSK